MKAQGHCTSHSGRHPVQGCGTSKGREAKMRPPARNSPSPRKAESRGRGEGPVPSIPSPRPPPPRDRPSAS